MNKDDEEILNERISLSELIRKDIALSIAQSKGVKRSIIKCPNCGDVAFDGSDCSSCGLDIYSYDPYDK